MRKIKGLLMSSLLLVGMLTLVFSVQLAKAETDELLAEREGFGRNTYGGLGGTVYHVTTLADSGNGSLRAGAESDDPLWIVFDVSGTIQLNSLLEVKSDKTFDGRGANVTITGYGFNIKGVSNIIVTHLVFDTAGGDNLDAIRIYDGAHDIWVHHCTFKNWTDGCVDITEASTDVTVSWCRFWNHSKTMLIGASPDATGDVVIRATVHHNFFNGTRQRNPWLRFGKVDAYNNYLYNWDLYGMRVTMYGQLLVEANIFEAGSDKDAVIYADSDPAGGYVKLVNNLLLNGAVANENGPEQVFNRSDYYTATIETANSTLKDKIVAEAGAGTPAMTPHSPEASFAYTPSPPIINQTVTFDASASHPGWNGTAYVPIANYTWDFGDENTTTLDAPTATITHVYSSNLTFTVNLTVTCVDDPVLIAGSLTTNSTWQNITVTPPQPEPPVASFTRSLPPYYVNETVISFDASGSSAGWNGSHDVPIANYTWYFGDGNTTTVTTATITHVYNSAGTFTVNLTVTCVDEPVLIAEGLTSDSTWQNITVILPQESPIGVTHYPWPMKGRGPNRIGYTDSPAPKTNDLLWSRDLGSDVYSSPAVADGLVFVGTVGPGMLVAALNMTTGEWVWNHTLPDRIRHGVAVASGLVLVGSEDGYLYALDEATGEEVWKYLTGDQVRSAPAVAGGLVFFTSKDWKVYALNMTTGALVWSYQTGGTMRNQPAVAGGLVFAGSDDGKVYALNEFTGTLNWSYQTGGSIYYGSPAVADGKVFIGSEDFMVYALDMYTGSKVWNYTTESFIRSAPAVAGGLVFIGSTDAKVYAINMTTGALVWSYQTGDFIRSSPAVADGLVFIGSADGNVYAIGTLLQPPVASFTVSPAIPAPSEVVTFNASASYDPDETIVSYEWDFGDGNVNVTSNPTITHKYVAEGVYNVTLNVTDTQGLWNFTSKTVSVSYLAMAGFTVTLPYGASALYPGWGAYPEEWRQIRINVTVENRGAETKNFTVTTYYGDQVIHDYYGDDAQNVTNLAPGENITLTFCWDTTDVPPCTIVYPQGPSNPGYYIPYNLNVNISSPALGEINVIGGNVTVRRTGDANGDGHCKSADFTILAMAWWTVYPSPDYDPRADFNGDGQVKSADFTLLAMNWYMY